MKTYNKIILSVFFLLTSKFAFAEAPQPPLIVVNQDRTTVTVEWSPVSSADGYQLLYAPYPYTGPDSIETIEMGDSTFISSELWDGAAFYVAATAFNNEGSSDFSNVELFTLSAIPQLDPDALPVTGIDWYRPPVSISWQWQLVDEVNTDYAVALYDIDLFDSSIELINGLKASGKKVICYFSAGSYENFREDKDKFDVIDRGNILDDWPDEQWLDIRSLNVAEIMVSRLNLAVQKGCDGVEPDNMTAYKNDTGFDLTARDQLAFNKFIANESHKRGLSVGLKNDLEQIPELVDYFDFHVSEQCHEFDECDTLTPFIEAGKPVLNAEYLEKFSDDPSERQVLCETANNSKLSTLVLPLDLDDSFRFSCF